MTRDELATLIDRMLVAEAHTTAPPAGEEGDWLYGNAGFTDPDEHGRMAPLPSARVWMPRALVFWRMVLRTGAPVNEELRRDPRHSLARWPTIEAAVPASRSGALPDFSEDDDLTRRVEEELALAAATDDLDLKATHLNNAARYATARELAARNIVNQ